MGVDMNISTEINKSRKREKKKELRRRYK
jgi:hypothetical protein